MHEDIFEEVNQPQLSFRLTAKHTDRKKLNSNMIMKTDWSGGGGGVGGLRQQNQSIRIKQDSNHVLTHSAWDFIQLQYTPGH